MSALIRAGRGDELVRPLGAARGTPLSVVAAAAPDPDPAALALAALRNENDALKKVLEDTRAAAAEAEARARSDGRKDGLAAAKVDDDRRLQAAADALAAAAKAWDERLASLDGLAAAIARASLSKLFGEWDSGSELVLRAAAHQLGRLRRDTIVAVRVSRKDFADEAALAAAAASLSLSSAGLVADPQLAAGACRIDLKLGHVDVGPATQWTELAAMLDSLAAGQGSAA